MLMRGDLPGIGLVIIVVGADSCSPITGEKISGSPDCENATEALNGCAQDGHGRRGQSGHEDGTLRRFGPLG